MSVRLFRSFSFLARAPLVGGEEQKPVLEASTAFNFNDIFYREIFGSATCFLRIDRFLTVVRSRKNDETSSIVS